MTCYVGNLFLIVYFGNNLCGLYSGLAVAVKPQAVLHLAVLPDLQRARIADLHRHPWQGML